MGISVHVRSLKRRMTAGSVHAVCLTVLSLLVSRLGQSIDRLITMGRLFDHTFSWNSATGPWRIDRNLSMYIFILFQLSSRVSLSSNCLG